MCYSKCSHNFRILHTFSMIDITKHVLIAQTRLNIVAFSIINASSQIAKHRFYVYTQLNLRRLIWIMTSRACSFKPSENLVSKPSIFFSQKMTILCWKNASFGPDPDQWFFKHIKRCSIISKYIVLLLFHPKSFRIVSCFIANADTTYVFYRHYRRHTRQNKCCLHTAYCIHLRFQS